MMKTVDFTILPGSRILAEDLIFPECPRFHEGKLYIVDGPAVRAFDLSGNRETVAQLPTMQLLGLQIEPDGTLYFGAAFDRTINKVSGGAVSQVADLSADIATPTNELVRLSSGNFLVGKMGFNILAGETPAAGGMNLVKPDGSVTPTGPEIFFPNGLVLLDGERSLLVVGDMGKRIYRLELDETGAVTGSSSIDLKDAVGPVAADGMALSRDGQIWYGDMHNGVAVQVSDDGTPQIVVRNAMNHVSAVWLFEVDGEEWLAMTGLMTMEMPQSPDQFSARLAIAPMAEILAAAE
jgi:sugar lactone lactonase YvrE